MIWNIKRERKIGHTRAYDMISGCLVINKNAMDNIYKNKSADNEDVAETLF